MVKNQNLEELVKEKGWQRKSIGKIRSNHQIVDLDTYILYVRERSLDGFLKKPSFPEKQNTSENRINSSISKKVLIEPMGTPETELTPKHYENEFEEKQLSTDIVEGNILSDSLPELAKFNQFPSLALARPDNPCILIGYDSEWQNLPRDRYMLSWQYAVVWRSKIIEFCFLRNCKYDLSLYMAVGCILDYLDVPSVDVRHLRRYLYCTGWENNKPVTTVTSSLKEAREKCVYTWVNDGFTHERICDKSDKYVKRGERDWSWFHTYLDYSVVDPLKVTILCHTGKVDLSGLSYDDEKYLLRYLKDVQGGLVSLQPVRIAPRSMKNVNNLHIYPISLSVSDTMCHAPADNKSLARLGDVIGIPKYDLPVEQKENMAELLANDPVTFLEYASNDSIVTLMYSSALYGYNNTPPVTVTSAAAKVVKDVMMRYLGCDNNKDFNEKYRGLKKVSHGLVARDHSPGYIEASSLEPVSDMANSVQYYASQSFHGGYNICCEVGAFLRETHDFDLKNAYPTAMCLVPDINWVNPIRSEVIRRELNIGEWSVIGGFNPVLPFVGYVKFEFPEEVQYPCIPINVDGVPVYPRSSEGLDGVYVAGPYVYLALRLGARVWCERGYFLNTLFTENFQESHSMAVGIKQLVIDRDKAKKICGKGSLEELILKVMGNSIYGKIAQNVINKTTWSAFRDCMEDIGCSIITNPVSATMTTSIVQCLLLAAQNQLQELGYMTCSVTTDGFISNCSLDILRRLDLYGFKPVVETSRIYLSGSPELWECKHAQNDLINFTTRGNISLHYYVKDDLGQPVCNFDGSIMGNPMMIDDKPYDGVCAHNGTKSGYVSDSYEDRLWLMVNVLKRTGPVGYEKEEWTSTKDIIHGKSFFKNIKTEWVSMDYDMKRKPERDSFTTDYPVVEDITYEIAHFKTEPYNNIEEFKTYRQKKKLVKVLRTMDDWNKFWMYIDTVGSNAHVYIDKEWSILRSCIMGYRAGRWDIPGLTACKNNEEKYAWINKHNESKKKFTESDWKNCSRPKYQVNMLPVEMIQDKLNELIDDVE